jgi:hypothetical protein
MAVVLPSDDSNYFGGSGSLRRSHSQTRFGDQTSYHSSGSEVSQTYHSISRPYPHSAPSSAPSSPRTTNAESNDQSYASTPASNFSLASDDYDETPVTEGSFDDHFGGFPSYKEEGVFMGSTPSPDDHFEPPPSPKSNSYTPSDEYDSSISTPKPDTPEFPERAEDDTAATTRPTRQVDYLSHDWREEDIWSSWKYIVSRRGEYANSERLENASWRTWMKAKNDLKTISPESLNWLKDCDVTWLYGPLQPGCSLTTPPSKPESPDGPLRRTNSLANLDKKPILKKRSMSEVMLQRSISAASLLKQAAAAVQAQEKETKGILRPALSRSNTDYVTFPFSTRRMSHGNFSSMAASSESSGVASPSAERKHIHFNEQVEQCIALEVKQEDEDDVDTDRIGGDSDSDDGVMMKRTQTKKRGPLGRKRTKTVTAAEGKTIAMLPSTTLKYREDTPEPQETAMKHSRSPLMSPSSSQETLRPSGASARFFFDEEDDVVDNFCDPNVDWRPTPDISGGLQRTPSSGSLTDEPAGMRRTPSGMFMPYEESETAGGDGIFGRVVDTVNTARDIAHVIWNVGWRK